MTSEPTRDADTVPGITSRMLFDLRREVSRMQEKLERADLLLNGCFGDPDMKRVTRHIQTVRGLIFDAKTGYNPEHSDGSECAGELDQ